MQFKNPNALTITECFNILGLKAEGIKKMIKTVGDAQRITPAALLVDYQMLPEIDQKVADRLAMLIREDAKSFGTCSTEEAIDRYLNTWSDGLWREEANANLKKIKEDKDEIEFFNSNKSSVEGLKKYLHRYPTGKYAAQAHNAIVGIKRKRKTVMLVASIAFLVLAVILVCTNYESASYISVTESISFDKKGGNRIVEISTDASPNNIRIMTNPEAEGWVKVSQDGKQLIIDAEKNFNESRDTEVKVFAYSKLFDINLNKYEKTLHISQSSGIPNYLNVSQSEIHFDKYGNTSADVNSMTFTVSTDAMELQIVPDDTWYVLGKDITEDEDGFRANITVSAETNEEGLKYSKISITAQNLQKDVTIEQDSGLASYFDIDRTSISVEESGIKEGWYVPVKVETDGTAWSVKYCPSWINAEPKIPTGILSVTLGPNTGKKRSGTIELMSNNGHVREISVTQKGDPTNLSASNSSLYFGVSSDNSTVSISNDSNKPITASSSNGWINTQVLSGSRVKISCNSNNGDPRRGYVYVNCGNECTTITVTQKGWQTCPSCNGDGYRRCPGGTWDYMTNSWTHSITRSIPQYNYITGILEWQWVTENCPTCGGDGKIDCSKCKGKKKIEKSY